jgi:uncharacterized membrane protein
MFTVDIGTVINRPVEEVFAFLSNFENWPKWAAGLIEARKTSDGPIGRGTIWRSVSNVLGQRVESEAEVTEYEPNRKIRWKYKPGAIQQAKGQATFDRVEGGTRVGLTLEGESGGLLKLAEPVFANLAKRQFEAGLANLKDLMEAHAL